MSIDKISSAPVRAQRFDKSKKKERAPEQGAPVEVDRKDKATIRTPVVRDTVSVSDSPLKNMDGVKVTEQMASSLAQYAGEQISQMGPDALGAHGSMDSSRVAALLA